MNPDNRHGNGARQLFVATVALAATSMIASRAALGAQADGLRTIDLRPYYNNDGISSQANLDDGNFSEGILYPAESLPATEALFRVEGIPFVFPSKDDRQLNNLNCRGQTIDLPDRPAAALCFLGASDGRLFVRGHHRTTVTLRYVDGRREQHPLWLTPWDSEAAHYGNRLAIRTDGFHVQNRVAAGGGRSLFMACLYPRRSAPLERLQLGADESVHLFALTMADHIDAAPPVSVDGLDWGAMRAGDNRATLTLRSLNGRPATVDVSWLDSTWSVDVAADRHQVVPLPYRLEPGQTTPLSLGLSAGGQSLFDAQRRVQCPPLVRIETDRRLYLRGVTHGEIDVVLNVDAADLNDLKVRIERTGGKGGDAQPFAQLDASDVAPLRYELATTGRPDLTQQGIRDGRLVTLRHPFALRELRPGDHRFRATVLRGGEALGQAQTRLIQVADVEPAPTNVAFDADGVLRVRDERTFPLGIICGNLDEQVIDELHEAGFNVVLPANPLSESYPIARARALMDRCHERGLGVILELKAVNDPLHLSRIVLTFRDHPALIGWHLFEEPVYPQFTVDEIDTTWREMKRLDPCHFFDVIDWSYTSMAHHAPWSGVLIPDRYPIGPEPVVPLVQLIREQVQVAQAASLLRPKAPGGQKPVWTCLQTMTLMMGIDRAPTAAEIRAQTFESIVAGARGILFFEYFWARRSRTFDVVADQVRQVRELMPVLVDANPVRQAETDAPLDTWVKRHDGFDYLIAVNESEETVEAKLSLPGAAGLGRIDALFEERRLAAGGGGFEDTFGPLAVHVYRIQADTARDVAALYPVYPYGPMNRQNPGHRLGPDAPNATLAAGELEGICLAIDNRDPGAQTIDYRVQVRGDLGPDRVHVARLAYLPHRGHNRPAYAGAEMADAIVPVTSIDPVTVAAGECRHVWLTVDGRGVKPGAYRIDVTLDPLTARRDRRPAASLSASLSVRVEAFELPAQTPLTVYSWDQTRPLSDDAWMQNFVEHRMNAFCVRMDTHSRKSHVKLEPDGSLAREPDFSDLTELIQRGKPHGRFYIESFRFRGDEWECTDGTMIKWNTEEWAKGYRQWVRAFKRFMESQGVGTDQWLWCPVDEAFFQRGEEKSFVQAKIVYEIDPTIVYLHDTWPTRGPEQVTRYRGVSNVTWCPDSGVFGQAPWAWLRAEGRPMWEYFCYHHQRGFEPHSLYRGAGPRAWNRKLSGTAFFAPLAHTGSTWNDLDGPWGDSCLVLDGPDGKPINTRRWEAWREGIEDYLYLYLLDQALGADGARAELIEEGRQLIAEFCDLYERQTDHRYLGDRRRGWSVSAQVAQRTEQVRRRMGQLLSAHPDALPRPVVDRSQP